MHSTKISKLRLIITEKCNRNCKGCCNNDWDLSSLPVVKDYTPYDMILLTGGEPMLDPCHTLDVIDEIRKKTGADIYVYTSKVDDVTAINYVLHHSNGLTVTLHKQSDVGSLMSFNDRILASKKRLMSKSLRLNVFKGIDILGLDMSMWTIKNDITWLKKHPLPEGEVLMRYKLYEA